MYMYVYIYMYICTPTFRVILRETQKIFHAIGFTQFLLLFFRISWDTVKHHQLFHNVHTVNPPTWVSQRDFSG